MKQCFLLFMLQHLFLCAYSANKDSTRSIRFAGFPVVFYTPETEFGFGAAGSATFRMKKETNDTYPSQITFGLAYSTNGQILAYLPFRIYALNEKILLYGESGFYRYTYNFFGVGNSTPLTYFEKFTVRFFRNRLNLLYKASNHFYIGPRLWFEDFAMLKREENGLLDQGNITGYDGSRAVGLGITTNFDYRDNILYPRKGCFAEIAWQHFSPHFGSSTPWTRYLADVAAYFPIKRQSVIAIHGVVDWSDGDPPFQLMAQLGGTRRMRGYYEGRFRDKKALLLQSEFRSPLYKRFGFTVFGSLGYVGESATGLLNALPRTTAGAGLRFRIDRREKLNLRLDVAFGKMSNAFYFTFGEAF